MAAPLTKVGRFEVVSVIGRGSMGIVYRGFDPVIGRNLAIKTMLSDAVTGQDLEEYRKRFQVEAQAAGVLTHPNIVTIYDFGFDEESDVLYMAMEFLEGGSLQSVMEERGILSADEVVAIVEQICSGLAYAHQRDIVHRDIKPANIMVNEDGDAKITDFGIAKVSTAGLTQDGQILGTPHYMSPEQVKGRKVTGASDIFSVGVILYEMLTGEKPFGGKNITTVIYKIINEEPIPPRELDASIHPGLNYIISRALAKQVEDRYKTCKELTADLKNYRNLGELADPSDTVMARVPTLGDTISSRAIRPEPPPPDARPPSNQPISSAHHQAVSSTRSPAPARSQRQPQARSRARKRKSSAGVTFLGILLLALAAASGGYYYQYFLRPTMAGREIGPHPLDFLFPGLETPVHAQQTPPSQTQTGPPDPWMAAGPGPDPLDFNQGDEALDPPPPIEEDPLDRIPRYIPPPGDSSQAANQAPTRQPTAPSRPVAARLMVSSHPSGVAISLDGEPAGITPKVFSLEPGSYLVEFEKEGYESARQSVDLDGGDSTPLKVDLKRLGGSVEFLSVPSGAAVFVDGKLRGSTPVRVKLPVGRYRFTIQKAGYEPFQSSFSLKLGAHSRKRVVLAPGQGPPMGVIEVRTIPPGALVTVDGQRVGGPTPTSFQITAGAHTMEVRKRGFRPARQDLEVPADGAIAVNVKMERTQ